MRHAVTHKGAETRQPWDSWLPALPWICPSCGVTRLTREANPRCSRCGYREQV